MGFVLNPAVRRDETYRGIFSDDDYRDVAAFYAARPDLAPTPLRSVRALAGATGIHSVVAKDESGRFGLNAFKIAGVRYALDRIGPDAIARGLTCATAGNHGRAVARAARDLGVPCTVFVASAAPRISPVEQFTRASRLGAMRSDGARIVEQAGSYEDAVARAAKHGRDSGAAIISDTSWEGYEEIPKLIMAGYTRLFSEAARQWDRVPDVVFVQAGVGGLVCAAASWFADRFGAERPFLIACEPDSAACLMASAAVGHPVNLAGRAPAVDSQTMMAGLRCSEPSPAAWPAIRDGVDAFMSVSDDCAMEVMDVLASPEPGGPPITAGPSGACGAGALLSLARAPDLRDLRKACRFSRSTRAMVVITEGR